jgi:hypothetical protein
MVNLDNALSTQGLGDCTAEARRARSKEFLIKKNSELCELCASAVKFPFLLRLRLCRAVSSVVNSNSLVDFADEITKYAALSKST